MVSSKSQVQYDIGSFATKGKEGIDAAALDQWLFEKFGVCISLSSAEDQQQQSHHVSSSVLLQSPKTDCSCNCADCSLSRELVSACKPSSSRAKQRQQQRQDHGVGEANNGSSVCNFAKERATADALVELIFSFAVSSSSANVVNDGGGDDSLRLGIKSLFKRFHALLPTQFLFFISLSVAKQLVQRHDEQQQQQSSWLEIALWGREVAAKLGEFLCCAKELVACVTSLVAARQFYRQEFSRAEEQQQQQINPEKLQEAFAAPASAHSSATTCVRRNGEAVHGVAVQWRQYVSRLADDGHAATFFFFPNNVARVKDLLEATTTQLLESFANFCKRTIIEHLTVPTKNQNGNTTNPRDFLSDLEAFLVLCEAVEWSLKKAAAGPTTAATACCLHSIMTQVLFEVPNMSSLVAAVVILSTQQQMHFTQLPTRVRRYILHPMLTALASKNSNSGCGEIPKTEDCDELKLIRAQNDVDTLEHYLLDAMCEGIVGFTRGGSSNNVGSFSSGGGCWIPRARYCGSTWLATFVELCGVNVPASMRLSKDFVRAASAVAREASTCFALAASSPSIRSSMNGAQLHLTALSDAIWGSRRVITNTFANYFTSEATATSTTTLMSVAQWPERYQPMVKSLTVSEVMPLYHAASAQLATRHHAFDYRKKLRMLPHLYTVTMRIQGQEKEEVTLNVVQAWIMELFCSSFADENSGSGTAGGVWTSSMTSLSLHKDVTEKVFAGMFSNSTRSAAPNANNNTSGAAFLREVILPAVLDLCRQGLLAVSDAETESSTRVRLRTSPDSSVDVPHAAFAQATSVAEWLQQRTNRENNNKKNANSSAQLPKKKRHLSAAAERCLEAFLVRFLKQQHYDKQTSARDEAGAESKEGEKEKEKKEQQPQGKDAQEEEEKKTVRVYTHISFANIVSATKDFVLQGNQGKGSRRSDVVAEICDVLLESGQQRENNGAEEEEEDSFRKSVRRVLHSLQAREYCVQHDADTTGSSWMYV